MDAGDQLLDVPPGSAAMVSHRLIRRGAHVRGLVADLERAVAKYAKGCHCSRLSAALRARDIARALADRSAATSKNPEPTRRKLTHPPLIRRW